VVHKGQRLAFSFEPGDNLFGIHPQLDDLEGDAPANQRCLLGHINNAATAFAELLENLIVTDCFRRLIRVIRFDPDAGVARTRTGRSERGGQEASRAKPLRGILGQGSSALRALETYAHGFPERGLLGRAEIRPATSAFPATLKKAFIMCFVDRDAFAGLLYNKKGERLLDFSVIAQGGHQMLDFFIHRFRSLHGHRDFLAKQFPVPETQAMNRDFNVALTEPESAGDFGVSAIAIFPHEERLEFME
jgi:hypothetical protein